jgi:hypothetical protein
MPTKVSSLDTTIDEKSSSCSIAVLFPISIPFYLYLLARASLLEQLELNPHPRKEEQSAIINHQSAISNQPEQ